MMNANAKDLGQLVAGLPAGVFLADLDGARLRLHVRNDVDVAKARVDAGVALEDAALKLKVEVLSHSVSDLAFPKSIEHWLRKFAAGSTIYDPTMVSQRARVLVTAAKACRAEFGKTLTAVFFDPGSRAVVLEVHPKTGSETVRRYQQRAVEIISAAGAGADWNDLADAAGVWPITVRVVPKPAPRKLVAIDAASASIGRRLSRMFRVALAPGAMAIAVSAVAYPATAKTTPASPAMTAPAGFTESNSVGTYGILSGLSVFSDGQLPSAAGDFMATGLDSYFGSDTNAKSGIVIRVAQTVRRAFAFDDSGPSGAATASPGS
jgi:hypothetical protein